MNLSPIPSRLTAPSHRLPQLMRRHPLVFFYLMAFGFTWVYEIVFLILLHLPDTIPCTPNVGRWILLATILGSSMVFIDGSVVTVALPVLQVDLHATAINVQWIMESYSLLLATLLLVGGALGDHLGRRRVFAVGVALFILASIWCGFSSPSKLFDYS